MSVALRVGRYRGACCVRLECEGIDCAASRAIHGRALQASREVGKGYPLSDDPSALAAFEVWLRAINASDELALKVWAGDDYTAGVSLRLGNNLEPSGLRHLGHFSMRSPATAVCHRAAFDTGRRGIRFRLMLNSIYIRFRLTKMSKIPRTRSREGEDA